MMPTATTLTSMTMPAACCHEKEKEALSFSAEFSDVLGGISFGFVGFVAVLPEGLVIVAALTALAVGLGVVALGLYAVGLGVAPGAVGDGVVPVDLVMVRGPPPFFATQLLVCQS